MRRHLLLVGLPGAGKTTAGRRAAGQLGAPFLDGDALVEAAVGRPVARIFAEDGEPAFRRHERVAVAGALAGPPAVIAPGGGWAIQPGNLEAVGNALVVHLAVSPDVAGSRLGASTHRPLLAPDPRRALERLAGERLPLYRRAERAIETDTRTPEEVADLLVQLARSEGGW